MKYTISSPVVLVALAFATTVLTSSCKQYDREVPTGGTSSLPIGVNEVQLLHVTSDVNEIEYDFRAVYELSLNSNLPTITKIRSYSSTGAVKEFAASKLKEERGIVLMTSNGWGKEYDTMSLRSSDFKPTSGGTLTIHYLYQAYVPFLLDEQFADLTLQVVRKNSSWIVYKDTGRTRQARQIKITKNTSSVLRGKMIGIKSIEAF